MLLFYMFKLLFLVSDTGNYLRGEIDNFSHKLVTQIQIIELK